MMLELLGSRIIGPFYGISLIVWSALLSVALLALALGYAVGGKLADRGGHFRLPHALLFAAAWASLIPVISEPVQMSMNDLGLRWGAFLSAFVLFAPPLTMLGMTGPFVIRRCAERIDNIGSLAGNIYAVSTVGSVCGTVLFGFYLLPWFGSITILCTMSLALSLLAGSVARYEQVRHKVGYSWYSWCIGLALQLVWLSYLMTRTHTVDGYTIVFEQETHYGWVRVVDQTDENIRWLLSNGSTIGAEHLESGEGLLAYQHVAGLIPWFNPEAKRALLIGLGSGHLVNALKHHEIRTDAIEIDPAVAYAAPKFFNFHPTGKILIGDGRYQIKKLPNNYDFIIHDCFTGGAEPYYMLSTEMISELKKKLSPGGILAVNFLSFTDPHRLRPVQSIARTLDQSFAHRRTFVAIPGEIFNDYIFFVSNSPLKIASPPVADWLVTREVHLDGSEGELLTDNYNPLEYLRIETTEYYRNVLIDRIGPSVLFR